MKRFTCCIVFSGFTFFSFAQDQEEWIQLFNGKDLSGWDVKIKGFDLNDNFGETFRVIDGNLAVD